MGVDGRVGGLKGQHQLHSPNGLRPQGKLRLEEMLDNGSVSESASSVRVNAVAECSFRGRVRWGKVVKKWVLRLASFPEGREQGGSSNWVQN